MCGVVWCGVVVVAAVVVAAAAAVLVAFRTNCKVEWALTTNYCFLLLVG